MIISFNPTYFCNFSCSFCYLTPEQLRDKTRISLEQLGARLAEVSSHTTITHFDVYGGEPSLLDVEYWYAMKEVIRRYYEGPINVITNLSRIHPGFLDDDVGISVSYDFECRQTHKNVFTNAMLLEKPFSILMLASPCLVQKPIEEMVEPLNLLSQLVSVEIKPYSWNQANQLNVTHKEFEDFILKWLNYPGTMNFEFVNRSKLDDVLDGHSNSFSDDHVYLTPSGKFAVLEFDENDNEFFLELDKFEDYLRWTEVEKARVYANPYCSGCEFLGKCLSEHLRNVTDTSNSCSGYRGLIEAYRSGL